MSECGKITDLLQCNNETVCSSFSLTTDPANCYIESLVEEHLNLGAADLNVFKLLGIHEQGSLVDLTGSGVSISSGEYPDYKAINAFNTSFNEWRSTQRGPLVTSSSYIGYDFGPIKLDNGRLQYSVETQVRFHITSIRIKQGCEKQNRVSKARVERSDDNITWFGVAVINLPDSSEIETISFKQSAPSRYWRVRPIVFLGSTTDYWAVKQLELIDYNATHISNVQDELGFLENRDRSYAKESIRMKGFYDLQEYLTDLTRFGIDMSSTQQFVFKIAFSAAIRSLGRPVVIGDIIEVPSEIQFSPNLTPIKKYLEVSDVGWATEGFTPGWKPTILRVAAIPMMASQETMDIIGNINAPTSSNNFFGLEQPLFGMEGFAADAKIHAAADSQVQERGEDIANVRLFTEQEIATAGAVGVNLGKFNLHQKTIYVEDGMPPNGEAYTEGVIWPDNPLDGAYHRLTYESRLNIAPRLHKYSVLKNRWIFVEEDRRMLMNNAKPTLNSMIQDPTRINNDTIGDNI